MSKYTYGEINDEEETDIESLLGLYICNLVSHPDQVNIDLTESQGTHIYSIEVPDEDRGKIIGSNGCVIDSLQTIFHALGCKREKKVILEIEED